MSTIETYEEQRRNALNQELKAKAKFVNDALTVNAEVRRLPEYIFKESFLPYFTGMKEVDASSDILLQWISVAGTPTSEVEIIDETGKALFRVPPIIDTSIINPLRTEGNNISIHAIISLSNQANIPIVGERSLIDNLSVKAKEIQKRSEVFETNEQRWLDIFNRYNLNKEQLQAKEANKGQLTDDDLIF